MENVNDGFNKNNINIINKDSFFETNLINKYIFDFIYYLDIKDIMNTLFLNKNINKIICNKYILDYIKNKASIKISNIITKYFILITNMNDLDIGKKLSSKYIALYYYRYYNKNYINYYYNMQHCNKKKYIIDKYKNKYTDNPTRTDLFFLIRNIPIKDIMYIGW
jgi:hypothetical protein